MSAPIPLTERRQRMPVAGRIRAGVKGRTSTGKVKGVAIETFRFTCRRSDDLDVLAGLYGGTVRPWTDPKSEDRFEVITEASEIRVALPPDPLGESFMELWGGKGCERRCDGIRCEVAVRGPDGLEWDEAPCLCRQRGIKECKPKIRLCVLLPELPLRGVWRFDTSSEAALDELPGMVETLQTLQGEGLTEGLLRLERRQSQGGKHRFVVPVLGLAESLEGLIAGRARLAALPQSAGGEQGMGGSVPQLPPAPSSRVGADSASGGNPTGDDAPSLDDEIVDAEIVDEPSPREKNRLLTVARSRAILEGKEPPQSYEEAVDANLIP